MTSWIPWLLFLCLYYHRSSLSTPSSEITKLTVKASAMALWVDDMLRGEVVEVHPDPCCEGEEKAIFKWSVLKVMMKVWKRNGEYPLECRACRSAWVTPTPPPIPPIKPPNLTAAPASKCSHQLIFCLWLHTGPSEISVATATCSRLLLPGPQHPPTPSLPPSQPSSSSCLEQIMWLSGRSVSLLLTLCCQGRCQRLPAAAGSPAVPHNILMQIQTHIKYP